MKAIYKRVLLKISGEALAGETHFGLNDEMLAGVAAQVKQLTDLGIQVAVVVGGGNFWRGRTSNNMDRPTADYMGMLATCMNGLALQSAFEAVGIPTRVQTAIEMREVAEPYARRKAMDHLEAGKVVIFAAGTGSPFFSTDTTAALRAAEVGAEVILLAKKIDAVYDADPEKVPDAKRFDSLTHQDILTLGLGVMDATAASICKENNIPIHVFGLSEKDGVLRAACGEKIGTIIK
ncbi:MAG: UMP kinase [Firmicutes bacterium]|nr:UMP kinase [Clostridiales bacterium]MBQ9931816.1 UMP kinase [Bacillota bacterium]